MRSSSLLTVGAGIVVIGSFVACGGGSTTTPTPVRSASPTPSSHGTSPPPITPTPGTPTPTASPTAAPTGALACVNQAVPDSYTLLEVGATYNQQTGSFTYDPSTSGWSAVYYSNELPTPTPSPTPSGPTPTPTATASPLALYAWAGVYNVSGVPGYSITNGCFAVVTTQSGMPFPSNPDNADAIGYPQFNQAVEFEFAASGHITSITLNANQNGGSGAFKLDNGGSGTIAIGPRQTLNGAEAQQRLTSLHAAARALRQRRGLDTH